MDADAEDLRRVRTWLDRDPVRYAHVIHLLSLAASQVQVWIDDPRRPRAVLAIRHDSRRLVAAAESPEKVRALLDLVPRGAYRLTSVDVELVPHLQEALEATFRTPVWLYRMGPQDLRPSRVAETRPVKPSEAPMIAGLWAPERDAVGYVRRRVEEGITSGIAVDGELVAWDMTHLETDRVVMLGFLHVKEAYRGRGYAKTVTTATAEKVFAEGKIAAAEVFEDNLPSLRLTEGVGFRRVRRQVWGDGTKV
ncbi:MAG: GNAT family N-acetyltransferase [Candidatus Thermoplasmatota archaeon]|nr:GNAT family N-acetyltransferase [Candidatus Thermoplasmatota archaeon]